MPGRTQNSPDYRYGFNGKEKDEDGEMGSLTTYDYGFRIYNPGIGKFLSVDPLTKSYPWYTPYQFAGNMPIWAKDLDGLEPVVKGGVLIGYIVQAGQGPTYIAADINNPDVQKEYGYNLMKPVKWYNIVYANTSKFDNVSSGDGAIFDKNNQDYWSGNVSPGDMLFISEGASPPITSSKPKPSPNSNSLKVKAAYAEGGIAVGFGFSINSLKLTIPEAEAAQQGSFDGGKQIQLSGGSFTGVTNASIELLGVTGGYLDVRGYSNGDIANGILKSEIVTGGGSAGEIINGKTTKVITTRGTTKVSGYLFGASLGVGVLPGDVDFTLGTFLTNSKVVGGIGNATQDTVKYIENNPGNAKLDSILNEIKNR